MIKNKKIFIYVGLSIISFIAGYIISEITSNKKEEIDGVLRIDNSDSDNVNGLFLELKVPIEYITNKKLVTFRTLKENYIRK